MDQRIIGFQKWHFERLIMKLMKKNVSFFSFAKPIKHNFLDFNKQNACRFPRIAAKIVEHFSSPTQLNICSLLSISTKWCINHTFHVFASYFMPLFSWKCLIILLNHPFNIASNINFIELISSCLPLLPKDNIHLTHFTVGVSLLMVMLFPMEIGVE